MMKRIKYFVLSLLVCFSFGCGPQTSASRANLAILLQTIGNVEKYQCVRPSTDNEFACTVEIANENKLVICTFRGCFIQKCANNDFCFESKANDTE